MNAAQQAGMQLWTNERIHKALGIVSDAQIDYMSSFRVDLTVAVKAGHAIRDDYEARIQQLEAQVATVWLPLPDGIVYHHTDKVPAEWNYPEHTESIEFLEVRDSGSLIACGSMPVEEEQSAVLPDDIRLCRRRTVAAEPVALDFPDSVGYWAFEGYVGDNPNVAKREDVVWVHNITLGIVISTWGEREETLHHYHGIWHKLTMPWDTHPNA